MGKSGSGVAMAARKQNLSSIDLQFDLPGRIKATPCSLSAIEKGAKAAKRSRRRMRLRLPS